MKNHKIVLLICVLSVMFAAGCTFGFDPSDPGLPTVSGGGGSAPAGQTATLVRVVDGDTIDVTINGTAYTVRYVGVNTPERDEVCYNEASAANRLLTQGQTLTLVKDSSETDRFGRLLRYVYAGSLFVNEALVQQGYAEVVSYPPDTAQYNHFRNMETEARNANRGCHPTGIFNDGSDTR